MISVLRVIIALIFVTPATGTAEEERIVTLTHTTCQFLEAENGFDHDFEAANKADCETINARTAQQRLADAGDMELTAGTYTFHVMNRDVPYEVGFWLREADYDWRNPLDKMTKLSVMGSGLKSGDSARFVVALTPGTYIYSCPLNTTPDYRLIVRE